MRKRRVIRIVSFISAFAVFFAASGMLLNRAKAAYEDVLGRVRLSGLTSLCEYVKDVSGGLRVLAVSANENVADAAAFVTARTMGALGSLSCFESEKTKNIETFLNGVCGFAEEFSDGINEEQRKNALDFSDYAQELYYHLSDVANAAVSGGYSLVEEGDIYGKDGIEYFESVLDFSNGKENELFSRFANAAAVVTQISDKNAVTVQQAKKAAADFMGIKASLLRNEGEEAAGGVVTYRFSHNGTIINVGKYTGQICRLLTDHICINPQFSFSQAEEAAGRLMNKLGCADYDFIYSENGDFSAKFVAAPVINGILFLPASVNIEICLGECGTMNFDASGFTLNYPAELAELKENADISKLIPENLILQKSRLCCADFDGSEKYCYLAECLLKNEKVLIFIDYHTLKTLKTVFL